MQASHVLVAEQEELLKWMDGQLTDNKLVQSVCTTDPQSWAHSAACIWAGTLLVARENPPEIELSNLSTQPEIAAEVNN